MPLESITIFTDGASRGNPGPGGFGAIIIAGWKVHELGGLEERTTNNRMELRAAISALSYLSTFNLQPSTITVYTDSSYLVNGITHWIHGWQKNGWKTKAKQDVENRDLWETLAELTLNPVQALRSHGAGKNAEQTQKEIEWRLVGGHVGVAGNARADEIATAFADGKSPKLYAGTLPNYSIKNIFDIGEDAEARDRKQGVRQRQNANAYSYVSAVDGRIETHKTWAECEKRVKGKRARYKKALSADEEKNLIEEWSTKSK